MSIYSFLLYTSIFLVVVVFIPDIFPYCSNCKSFKFRSCFKIHKAVKIRLWYSANKSICKKCCQKYNIENFAEYEQFERAKKRAGRYFSINLFKQ